MVCKYCSTFICISKLMEGMAGFTSFFLLEPTDNLSLDREREVFWNDRFFWGVYMFLNLHKYIYL